MLCSDAVCAHDAKRPPLLHTRDVVIICAYLGVRDTQVRILQQPIWTLVNIEEALVSSSVKRGQVYLKLIEGFER